VQYIDVPHKERCWVFTWIYSGLRLQDTVPLELNKAYGNDLDPNELSHSPWEGQTSIGCTIEFYLSCIHPVIDNVQESEICDMSTPAEDI
jgi:hypothetical protein